MNVSISRVYRLVLIPGTLLLIIGAYQNCGRQVTFSDRLSLSGAGDQTSVETAPPVSPETPNDEDSKATVKCDEEILKHENDMIDVADGASFDNVEGNLVIRALGDLGEISNVDGNVIIYSEDGGSVGLLDEIHGNIILCGMSALAIANSRGNVKTSAGDIGDLNNIRGNVVISDGDLTNADNIGGHLRISNGRILGTAANIKGRIELE